MTTEKAPQSATSFDRFSDRARMALANARQHALRLQHDFIGTEHLFLALLGDELNVAAVLLNQLKVNREEMLNTFSAQIKPGSTATGDVKLPFTPRARKVLERAIETSRAQNVNHVGTGHLLLGILLDPETPASQLIRAHIDDPDQLRDVLIKYYATASTPPVEIIPESPASLSGASLELIPDAPTTDTLSPSQFTAFRQLQRALANSSIFLLWGEDGVGKTTILRKLHAQTGGAYLTIADFLERLRAAHPLALEESLDKLLLENLAANSHVYMDDMDLIVNVVGGGCHAYPRSRLIDAVMSRAAVYAVEHGKKLLFGNTASHANAVHGRSYSAKVPRFTPADYAFLFAKFLPPGIVGGLDFKKVHRFAPHLDAYQIKHSCDCIRHWDAHSTDALVDYLRSQEMASNVDLGEVRPVELHQLKGVDDVIRALETNIILPLENDKLADELNLKPKRGVLLAGPAGTGKTTVGRALAHRLKSKFFLVDGTFIAGTQEFYGAIRRVFRNAKQNAPSIIFIDDSDVIFENGEEAGLYRYLLTMLDGLESESVGRVCVMLTAMNIANLPPALIRSGRIELWLEMRLPDVAARASILKELSAKLAPQMGKVDVEQVAAATDSFTGADLTRLIEDTKALYAYDKIKTLPIKPLTEYAVLAAEAVRVNKKRYAEAEQRARRDRPNRPPWFPPPTFDSDDDDE